MLHDLNLTSEDSWLKVFANDMANQCIGYQTKFDQREALSRAQALAQKYQFKLDENMDDAEQLNRFADRDWWYRKVRAVRNQRLSEIEREMGLVRQGVAAYSSNRSVKNGRYARARAEEFMARRILRNHIGEEFSLADCAASNHTNPEIRFAELMVRIRGFEEIAQEQNHTGLFLTITCPSRMHRSRVKHGLFNEKFDGTTPHQANEHLKRVGERVRAYLHRNGVHQYGVRVAEPHHDGTPHWHLLLFVAPHQINFVINAYRKYALQDSPNERGAQKQRFKSEIIDPSKGSAAGYVVKYISKSIGGKCIGEDLLGNNAVESAERIVQWAKDHRIRQFQTLGGPSVTVWRELRRIRQPFSHPALEAARLAADSGDWAAFVRSMGGIHAGRNAQPVRLHYDHKFAVDISTGEIVALDANKYNELSARSIRGLLFEEALIPTRNFIWHSQRLLKPIFNLPSSIIEKLRDSRRLFASEARETWTCVNNCTGGVLA